LTVFGNSDARIVDVGHDEAIKVSDRALAARSEEHASRGDEIHLGDFIIEVFDFVDGFADAKVVRDAVRDLFVIDFHRLVDGVLRPNDFATGQQVDGDAGVFFF